MARMKKGIHGSISGKIGDIVGSSWRGIDYIKSKPKRTKPPTEKELANRFTFAYTQYWLQPIMEFLKAGFRNDGHTVFGINAAKSYLYKHALTKDGFNSKIHPERMKVSVGDLPLSDAVKVEKTSPNELTFSWDKSPVKGGRAQDQIMLLAYHFKDENELVTGNAFGTIAGQFRDQGIAKLAVEPSLKDPDLSYHIYAAFSAFDRSSQSDSIYLGTIII